MAVAIDSFLNEAKTLNHPAELFPGIIFLVQ